MRTTVFPDTGTSRTEHRLPELLSPAGGREQLESAVIYGADAVYLGGPSLSLRAKSQGFDDGELIRATAYAHAAGVRVYYCLNAMPYDSHMPEIEARLASLPETGVDAIIAADPGVIRLARRLCPTVEIHLSTQAHSVNSAAVEFWLDNGVKRINLARELSQETMAAIIRKCPDAEFEVFVHGAMCLSLSGHCLISEWANARHANLGLCTQPCRFEYRGMTLTVEEAKRQGSAFLDVTEGEDFSAFWAPMDLCLLRWLEDIVAMGPHALKLEGRTKSGGHVAQTTDVYRTALDMLARSRDHGNERFPVERFLDELFHTASRPLSSGFFLKERSVEEVPAGFQPRPVVARLIEQVGDEAWRVQVRSRWTSGNDASLLLPGMERPLLKAGDYRLENHRGEKTDLLHPGMDGILHCVIEGLRPGLYVRA